MCERLSSDWKKKKSESGSNKNFIFISDAISLQTHL